MNNVIRRWDLICIERKIKDNALAEIGLMRSTAEGVTDSRLEVESLNLYTMVNIRVIKCCFVSDCDEKMCANCKAKDKPSFSPRFPRVLTQYRAYCVWLHITAEPRTSFFKFLKNNLLENKGK
ncbi:hypothetical protein AVEN_3502-1 [Araneus ventricosus]|uniref:Uncharacterized protein n=1 Tax=Araneus ventricosus TaxID=182803 RepID=A0A4Y2JPM1_ARAVE|nr:hypothetical protein AVEN_3502-1 [Araneus ventricosus]